MGITVVELGEGRPPNRDIKSMTALLDLPNRPPPTFLNPRHWSVMLNDFLAKCLVKDTERRPTALQMLSHPFVESATNSEVLRGLIAQCLAVKERQAEKERAARQQMQQLQLI